MRHSAPMTRIFGCARVLLACVIGIGGVGCVAPLPLIEGTGCQYLPGVKLRASRKQAKLGDVIQLEAIEEASNGCPRLSNVTFLLEDQVIAEDSKSPFLKAWTLDTRVFPALSQVQYDAPIFVRSEYTIQGKKLAFVAGPLFVEVR
jgi:hypothetical protein